MLLEHGFSPRYARSGHLLYARADGTVLAAPFDAGNLEITGPVVSLLEKVNVTGKEAFSLSNNGILLYSPYASRESQIIQVDRKGKLDTLYVLPYPM